MYEGNRPPGYPQMSNQAVFLFPAAYDFNAAVRRREGEAEKTCGFLLGIGLASNSTRIKVPPEGGRKERRRKPAVFSWELDLRPIPHDFNAAVRRREGEV